MTCFENSVIHNTFQNSSYKVIANLYFQHHSLLSYVNIQPACYVYFWIIWYDMWIFTTVQIIILYITGNQQPKQFSEEKIM